MMKRIEASIEASGRARPDLRSLRLYLPADGESRVVCRCIDGSDVATLPPAKSIRADKIFNSTDLPRRGEAARPSPVFGIPSSEASAHAIHHRRWPGGG